MAEVTGSGWPDDAFAIHHAEQFRPAELIGDQHVTVRDADGDGVLLCHASLPLGTPRPEISRVVIVVRGALRNSADYLDHARRAATTARVPAGTLIVAPQFLADVDLRPGRLGDRARTRRDRARTRRDRARTGRRGQRGQIQSAYRGQARSVSTTSGGPSVGPATP